MLFDDVVLFFNGQQENDWMNFYLLSCCKANRTTCLEGERVGLGGVRMENEIGLRMLFMRRVPNSIGWVGGSRIFHPFYLAYNFQTAALRTSLWKGWIHSVCIWIVSPIPLASPGNCRSNRIVILVHHSETLHAHCFYTWPVWPMRGTSSLCSLSLPAFFIHSHCYVQTGQFKPRLRCLKHKMQFKCNNGLLFTSV